MQFVHALAPVPELYVPCMQVTHEVRAVMPVPVEYTPWLHIVQSVMAADTGLNVPAGHLVHNVVVVEVA